MSVEEANLMTAALERRNHRPKVTFDASNNARMPVDNKNTHECSIANGLDVRCWDPWLMIAALGIRFGLSDALSGSTQSSYRIFYVKTFGVEGVGSRAQ